MALRSSSRRISALVAAAALPLSIAAASPVAAESTPVASLERYAPSAVDPIDPGTTTFSGGVNFSDTGEAASVVYAIDLSGSTGWVTNMDCNGDGVVDALDDLNGDGNRGDILDCEIAAVSTLNSELAGLPGSATRIQAGVVGYGSSARSAQVTPAGGQFVAPGATNADGVRHIDFVVNSLRRGSINQYTTTNVGTGTNFDNAVNAALDQLESTSGNRWLFFLSDGQASVSQTTLDRLAATSPQVFTRTFAVGTGAGANPCAASAPLGRIAAAGQDQCIVVTDPTQLAAGIVTTPPSVIDSVTVNYDGTNYPATVDAVGNFSVDIPNVTDRRDYVDVTVQFTGSIPTLTQRWSFVFADEVPTPTPTPTTEPTPTPTTEPTPTPTPTTEHTPTPTTEPTPSASPSPSASVSPSPTASPKPGALPATGSSLSAPLLIGAGLLIAGGTAATLAARRRQS